MKKTVAQIRKILWDGRFSLLRTVWFIFRVLPLSQAIYLPIIMSWRTRVVGCRKGSIEIVGKVQPGMIVFGFTASRDLVSYVNKKSYLEIGPNAKLVFRGNAYFGQHFSVLIRESTMNVGNGFSCNAGCSFSCVTGISIGDDCLFGGEIVVRDSDGHTIYQINDTVPKIDLVPIKNKFPVVIGNYVWVCNNCSVLKGSSIGDDSVVAYGSMVTRRFENNNVLIGGIPATILKSNIQWRA